eukprot:m.1020621 g.1020621  ORF g.1020621 m.1020621 type:complete len:213 (+) comp24087_c0_seq104:2639-3277(+)
MKYDSTCVNPYRYSPSGPKNPRRAMDESEFRVCRITSSSSGSCAISQMLTSPSVDPVAKTLPRAGWNRTSVTSSLWASVMTADGSVARTSLCNLAATRQALLRFADYTAVCVRTMQIAFINTVPQSHDGIFVIDVIHEIRSNAYHLIAAINIAARRRYLPTISNTVSLYNVAGTYIPHAYLSIVIGTAQQQIRVCVCKLNARDATSVLLFQL